MLTERLQLSPLTMADLDAVYAVYSNPQTWLHLPTGRHRSIAQTRAMIEATERKWQEHQAGYWAVRLTAPLGGIPADMLIGTGGITPLLTGAVAGSWNLGYRLDPASWGHGLATEIAGAGLRFAAEQQPTHPVLGRVLENNPTSYRVLEKIGLKLQWRGEFDAETIEQSPWLASQAHRIYADRELSPDLLHAAIALN